MSEEKKPYRIEGRPQTIIRVEKNKDNPFVMMDKRPLENPELSWKAKGILAYLLSRPDGWEVNQVDLVNRSSDGGGSVQSGMKELQKAGHVSSQYFKDEKGRFSKWIITVYEVPGTYPQSDFPQVDNPLMENPLSGESGLINNKLNNKELNKNTRTPKEILGIESAIRQGRPVTEEDLKAEDSWTGRQMFTEFERDLLDVYVEVTGQKPIRNKLSDWKLTVGEWLEIGATPKDIREAYKVAHPENGNGFNVSRPGSLTNTISMVVGKRNTVKTVPKFDPTKFVTIELEEK